MRRSCGHGGALVLAVIGVLMWGCRTVPTASGVDTNKTAQALAGMADCAKKTAVSVEVALSALENAMAAQDLAEKDLMAALKAGSGPRVQASERALKSATADADEARELVKQILQYAGECSAAAASADEESKRMAPHLSPRDAEASAKKILKLADVARNASKKADALTEALKTKWLIPVITTTTTTTSTTTTTTSNMTFAPSPTPVGRR